jgi:ubiquinone/menaquinone biosynthesis C-methylase UbiE
MVSRAWHDAENAHLYDAFTRKFRLYDDLATRLVDLADLRDDMTILDLACGTGVVSRIVLQTASPGALILVDMSEEMIRLARRNVSDCRCTCVVATAATVAASIERHSVDVVLCNAAVWQIEFDDLLEQLRSVLKPGGRFVFNTFEYDLRSIPTDGVYDEPFQPLIERTRAFLMNAAIARNGWEILATSEYLRENPREEFCHLTAMPFMTALSRTKPVKATYAERVASIREAAGDSWPRHAMWLYYSICPPAEKVNG